MKEISDELFVKDMRILWQNLGVEERNKLGDIIRKYFNYGERPTNLIEKMQIQI